MYIYLSITDVSCLSLAGNISIEVEKGTLLIIVGSLFGTLSNAFFTLLFVSMASSHIFPTEMLSIFNLE